MKAYPPKVHYRLHAGYITWILHRLSGLGLAFYLFLHIWVIHHISQGKAQFDEVMAVVQSPFFHIMEIGLLGCVAYHALNGLRVILLDYGRAADKGPHLKWVWATLAVTAFLVAVGGIPMLRLAFH